MLIVGRVKIFLDLAGAGLQGDVISEIPTSFSLGLCGTMFDLTSLSLSSQDSQPTWALVAASCGGFVLAAAGVGLDVAAAEVNPAALLSGIIALTQVVSTANECASALASVYPAVVPALQTSLKTTSREKQIAERLGQYLSPTHYSSTRDGANTRIDVYSKDGTVDSVTTASSDILRNETDFTMDRQVDDRGKTGVRVEFPEFGRWHLLKEVHHCFYFPESAAGARRPRRKPRPCRIDIPPRSLRHFTRVDTVCSINTESAVFTA
jgi:hypothetical protein